MQFDPVRVGEQPFFARVVEPVAGPVVDDEEDLPSRVLRGQLKQKLVESVSVEDGREAIREVRVLEGDRTEDMGGLSRSVCVDARLMAYARPGLVERSIEPEARFVFEEDDAAAGGCLFLSAGNR